MAIDSQYDDLVNKIRANLGEHFSNYMFIILDDDGDLYYDYTNERVGRMLLNETAVDMTSDPMGVISWEEEEEEIEGEEEEEF
tara:strand:+ start:851 stop:1099 length:249 start_codon:yes stop_codon:yes gene_type:complete